MFLQLIIKLLFEDLRLWETYYLLKWLIQAIVIMRNIALN